MKRVIELTPAEIQSGLDRVKRAEGLIRQLPEDHDGRNSWLLNYAAVYEMDAEPWAGEGLPPVGIDCETLWSSTTGEYVSVKVLAHDEDRAVVRFTTGSRKGEYDSDQQRTQYESALPIFRPIRTPEQIAADERQAGIQSLLETFNANFEGHVLDGLSAIWDAGYRKVTL